MEHSAGAPRVNVVNKQSTEHRSVNDRVLEQAKKQLLQYAAFRPESAVVLALAIIGAGLALIGVPWVPFPFWVWLLGGLLGYGAIALSTLRDKKFYEQVVNKTFSEQFNVREIRSKELQSKVMKALEYRELMVKEIQRRDNPVLDEHLMDAANRTEDWIAQIFRLAQSVDLFEQDRVISRDMADTPRELAQLQSQLRGSLGGPVQMELARTIELKKKQIESLQNLKDTMARARLQLDNTLTAMGTMYMQVKVLGSKDVNSERTQRLQNDMIEQVRSLEDTASAMDELYRAGFARGA